MLNSEIKSDKEIMAMMIEMVDAKRMAEIVRHLLEYSGGGVEVRQYLDRWAYNKKDIFRLFGNKLTLEKEVEYSLASNYDAAKEMITKFTKEEFSTPEYALCKYVVDNLSPFEVQYNVLNRDFEVLGSGTILRKGEKVSKALGRLVINSDNKVKESVQTKYSMLVQAFSAKGKAVVSIDPIDYITMSENASGWSSCHALDGCYKTGTLSYLMDPATAISYIKSSCDTTFTDSYGETQSFSNKNWRQIVSFSKSREYAIQVRQYPNPNQGNMETVAKMLSELFKNKNGLEYHCHAVDVESTIEDLHVSVEGQDLHYNDIAHGAFDTAYMVCPLDKEEDIYSFISSMRAEGDICEVGSEVRCLCGCGSWLHNGEYLYYEDYECEDCYDEEW